MEPKEFDILSTLSESCTSAQRLVILRREQGQYLGTGLLRIAEVYSAESHPPARVVADLARPTLSKQW